MIGQIRGILIEKKPPEILVDVRGITYEIQVPMSTLYQLPDVGQEVVLHTHFVVRDDAQLLYGFCHTKDKTLFRSLIRVNGVGPRMALVILSGMEPDEFVRVVRNNDVTAMVNMPGIGKKTAERLIVEMRDRLSEWQASEGADSAPETQDSASTVKVFSKDAEAALIGLGYKPQQAARAIAQVLKDNLEITDSEELIRMSLKSIV
ncbi:MAG: Holliday junction branch migration protein RuvA [Pseudomonadota bacterium]|nr:Holliday junction branch migration protein RuvA [Pseudomonadota bacterium]MEC8994066.1 Holliday junction branch migration protein RuvA [Pseudomonadota bacterium]